MFFLFLFFFLLFFLLFLSFSIFLFPFAGVAQILIFFETSISLRFLFTFLIKKIIVFGPSPLKRPLVLFFSSFFFPFFLPFSVFFFFLDLVLLFFPVS